MQPFLCEKARAKVRDSGNWQTIIHISIWKGLLVTGAVCDLSLFSAVSNKNRRRETSENHLF